MISRCYLFVTVGRHLCLRNEQKEVFPSLSSYLIDPAVRSAMEIQTDNAVLIFDEAHNMVGVGQGCVRTGEDYIEKDR